MTNPWLSLWLSAANQWTGAARGFATAEMQRQQTALMREWQRQQTEAFEAWSRAMLEFWSGGWQSPPRVPRRMARR